MPLYNAYKKALERQYFGGDSIDPDEPSDVTLNALEGLDHSEAYPPVTGPTPPQPTLGSVPVQQYIPSNPEKGLVTDGFPQGQMYIPPRAGSPRNEMTMNDMGVLGGRDIVDPRRADSFYASEDASYPPSNFATKIRPEYAPGSGQRTPIKTDEIPAGLNASPAAAGNPADALPPKPVSSNPRIAAAEEGASSKVLNPESNNQFDEQKLLNDYLLALKESKDNEAKLTTMNERAIDNSRLAMLGEGLSESASKMGNLMGKPTGSTMSGFGKEAGTIEQNNVDEQRKIYQGANPEVQLARTAQIATMLEGIRSSRAKSAQGAGQLAIPPASSAKDAKALNVTQTRNKDFGSRMAIAEKTMQDLEAKGYKPNTYGSAIKRAINPPILGKFTSSADDIAYDQARDEWIMCRRVWWRWHGLFWPWLLIRRICFYPAIGLRRIFWINWGDNIRI